MPESYRPTTPRSQQRLKDQDLEDHAGTAMLEVRAAASQVGRLNAALACLAVLTIAAGSSPARAASSAAQRISLISPESVANHRAPVQGLGVSVRSAARVHRCYQWPLCPAGEVVVGQQADLFQDAPLVASGQPADPDH
jgi:hypothetical protein